MFQSAESLKKADTAAGRALILAAVAANTAPSDTGPTEPMVRLGMYDAIDLICKAPAAGTYDVRVWWFYTTAQHWVLDGTIGTVTVAAAADKVFPLFNAGAVCTADGLYVEVLNFVAAANANIWAQARRTHT